MNTYTIYAELKQGTNGHDFVGAMSEYLDSLPKCVSYRIQRMKLGFRSQNIGEWRIDMDFKTMQDLDDSMDKVLYNKDTIQKHITFAKMVDSESLDHFLYRDFPDKDIK